MSSKPAPSAPTPDSWRGLWRLADPTISLASIASMLLGACAAAADGPISWPWLAATVAGILAIEVAKNALGEIVDYDSGTDLAVEPVDRSPFSGGKRVLVDGLLSVSETRAVGAVGYVVGIAVGLGIVGLREPQVLGLGLVGVACAFFYHARPLRLSYRGLGELAVALCYGPLVCCGTYLVQRHAIPAKVVWLSIPLGLLIAAFLWINEFPDYRADQEAAKRTLVVRLGRRRASRWFAAVIGAAFVALVVARIGSLPRGSELGLIASVPAVLAVRTLLAHPEETARLIPAQRQTLLSFVLYAVGAGGGILLAALTGG